MNLAGQRKGIAVCAFSAVLLAVVMLLGGCGYTMISVEELLRLAQMNAASGLEQENGQEQESQDQAALSQAERLESQMLSVLNLSSSKGHTVTSDSSLDAAASLFLDLILEEEKTCEEMEIYLNNLSAMKNSNTYALVYDGTLSSARVGNEAIGRIDAISQEKSAVFQKLALLSVSYGESGSRSAWLILVQYI